MLPVLDTAILEEIAETHNTTNRRELMKTHDGLVFCLRIGGFSRLQNPTFSQSDLWQERQPLCLRVRRF